MQINNRNENEMMMQINRNEMELVAQITNEIELSREVIMFCLSFSPTSLTHGIFPNKRTQEEEEDEQHLSHDSLYHSLTLSLSFSTIRNVTLTKPKTKSLVVVLVSLIPSILLLSFSLFNGASGLFFFRCLLCK